MKWDFGQVTIRNAYVHDNDCRGLWADMNAHDAVIDHSLVEHNLAEGIFYEISHGAVIRDNQVYGNGRRRWVVLGRRYQRSPPASTSRSTATVYPAITTVLPVFSRDRPDSTPPGPPARPCSRPRQSHLCHRRRWPSAGVVADNGADLAAATSPSAATRTSPLGVSSRNTERPSHHESLARVLGDGASARVKLDTRRSRLRRRLVPATTSGRRRAGEPPAGRTGEAPSGPRPAGAHGACDRRPRV